MAAFADLVRFIPTLGGTTDFVYSSAVGGCQSPALAGTQNGVKYKCYAVSNDLTQWELFEGTYNSGTGTFPRTTVLFNSSGTGTATGQSGAGTKINFSTVPQVALIAAAEDLISVEVANAFTSAQKAQGRSNIGMADGHIPGEPSNGAAAAGEVGEPIANSGAATLVSATPTNLTSITLTAGEWEITAGFVANGNGTTNMSDLWVSINTVTATGAFIAGQAYRMRGFTQVDPASASPVGNLKVNLSAPATYYLNAQSVFTGTAVTVTGTIRARRGR
jgi:prepilin-type processing-associated H-X9-DG protein